MRDLNRNIVEQQAVQWDRLGLELGLKDYEITNISSDNPNRSITCCRKMLQKWLNIDPSATWGKLDNAIKNIKVSSTISCVSTEKGGNHVYYYSLELLIIHMCSLVIVVSQLSGTVKAVYKATRFYIGKNTWPPEQPKEFTPLVLLHYEDERTIKDVKTITKTLQRGAISDVVSATISEPIANHSGLHTHNQLGEALKASKATTDISEILAPLEVNNKSQFILIEGTPGIGKTILLKHIAYSWAEQGMLQNYQLVLLVYLRDPTVREMNTPEQLFQYFCKPFGSNAEKSAITCSEYFLENNGKTLTLLLDGYDEMEELRDNSLIADILNRQVLPDCGLVVSSRPHASVLLHKQATLRVDILGFTEEQQKHYIEHSLNNQSQIKQLTTYLDQHSIISSLCYLPFNILLLLFLYKQGFSLPHNVTELYNIFICLTVCRNLSKYGITAKQAITDINSLPEPYGKFIQQLSKLSLQALNKNQLIFTLDEIKQFCPQVESIPGALNAFGLLQAIEHVSIFQTTTTFNFLHLSLQEFLAANYITTLTPDKELSILEEYFWRGSHSNMFTIYISITKGQRPSFRKFLSGGDDTIAIHSKFLDDELRSIHLYRCCNEASGDDRVCRIIDRNFSSGLLDFSHIALSTNDIENISIFLTCSNIKQWQWLNLRGCHIQDAGLRILHRILKSPITIKLFWLYDNDLSSSSDGCLADIVINCRVEELDISYNKTIGQTEEFFRTILSSPSLLKTLHIRDIYLSSRSVIMIFTLLKEKKTKLKVLHMADNDITEDACDIIAETLKVNSTLEYLDIHGNDISKEALQLIMKHNNTLTELLVPSNYSASDKEQILALQYIVNEERKLCECQAKLNVKFRRY